MIANIIWILDHLPTVNILTIQTCLVIGWLLYVSRCKTFKKISSGVDFINCLRPMPHKARIGRKTVYEINPRGRFVKNFTFLPVMTHAWRMIWVLPTITPQRDLYLQKFFFSSFQSELRTKRIWKKYKLNWKNKEDLNNYSGVLKLTFWRLDFKWSCFRLWL